MRVDHDDAAYNEFLSVASMWYDGLSPSELIATGAPTFMSGGEQAWANSYETWFPSYSGGTPSSPPPPPA